MPADLRKDIQAVGSMPLSVKITGMTKLKILRNLIANPSNYVSPLSVDALKVKQPLLKVI
ncbi:MAG: hypothetical protein ACLSA2_05275 [Candidatus Gastranaerophilaceae bacterium]